MKAAPAAPAPPSAYMFVYFTGNTIDGEKLRFAVSDGNNALQWKTLNDAQPILESHEGTQGLRDPFIMRSAEGIASSCSPPIFRPDAPAGVGRPARAAGISKSGNRPT